MKTAICMDTQPAHSAHRRKRSVPPRFGRVLAAVLTALLLLAFAAPAAAAAPARNETRETTQVRESDFRKSELSPYSEDGRLELTRTIPHTPSDDFSTVRCLITVGSVSTVSFRLHGAYRIEQTNTPLSGTANDPVIVTVTASNGLVTVSANGNALVTAQVIDIVRVTLAEEGGWAELRTSGNSQNNGRKYLGALRLKANSDGTVRFVNVVPTAHYLYGIIPYEMSESCNIEALKAQAVTAKTYAFGFTYTGDDYDITDSFTYQGYRGYEPGYPKCMTACLAVVGQILFYNGGVPLAFYGGTNGGETALPSHAFGTSPLDGAYEIKLDDADIVKGSGKLSTCDVTYGAAITNQSLSRLLTAEATSYVGHSVEVLSVSSIELNTPKYSGCQRNMTKVDATVRISDNGQERSVSLRFDATKLKSYGVVSGNYKIYWGRAISGGHRIYFGRWGHGLGLSQYGCDGHADEGWSWRQIIAFYFGRMQLTSVTEADPENDPIPQEEIVAFGVINTNGTRMRSGPGLSYPVVTQFAQGLHADVVTEDSGWLLCIVNGIIGYIRGDLVDIVLFPSPDGANQPVATAAVSCSGPTAEIMLGPSEYCTLAGTIRNGVGVEVWHEIGSWYHIRVNGSFYYIRKTDAVIMFWSVIDLHTPIRIKDGLQPKP